MDSLRPLVLSLCLVMIVPQVAARDEAQPYSIGRYTSSPWGFSTNSFWIEGPEGLVLVDTQFLPSATREAVELAEQQTGKKVVLAVALHANPDKFNGTQYLKSHGIRTVTSAQVRELIPAVDKLRRGWFYDRYKPDYPDRLVLPESLGSRGTALHAAGLDIKVHLYGAAVSRAHVVLELDRNLFVGDLVANHHHAWMELGEIDRWVKMLDELKELKPRRIYPGRGKEAGASQLDAQIHYLRYVKTLVEKNQPRGTIPEEVKERLVRAVQKQYSGYGNEYFLQLGIPAVWEKLARGELR